MRIAPIPLAIAALLVLAGCATSSAGPPRAAGSTTVRTLVDRNGDGVLEAGPGEPLAPRTELAPAAAVRRTLTTFAQISDLHVVDEESPLRVEPLDRLGGSVRSAFRPQESLSTQVLAATLQSIDALHPSLLLATGDLVDNAQQNELGWMLQTLKGGTVRPDSGARGYQGVQQASSADPFLYRPDVDAPRHPGLLARAQQPFTSPGATMPVLLIPSNHDLLVQGVVRADARLAAIAVGTRKLVEPSRAVLEAARAGSLDAVDRALSAPGEEREVPSDSRRRTLAPGELLRTLAQADRTRLTGGYLLLDRELAHGVRLLSLDTSSRTRGSDGELPEAELAWLAERLKEHAGERIMVVSPTPLENTRGGDRALALLDATPGVIAVIAGDTHRNAISPRRSPHGGYWLVRAASLADYPQQARMYRIVELTDKRVALQTWVVDHAGAASDAGWLGLAGISRDLAFLDLQGGRPLREAGGRLDRNATLYLP